MLRRVPTSSSSRLARASIIRATARRMLSFVVVMAVAQPYPIGHNWADEAARAPARARSCIAALLCCDAARRRRPRLPATPSPIGRRPRRRPSPARRRPAPLRPPPHRPRRARRSPTIRRRSRSRWWPRDWRSPIGLASPGPTARCSSTSATGASSHSTRPRASSPCPSTSPTASSAAASRACSGWPCIPTGRRTRARSSTTPTATATRSSRSSRAIRRADATAARPGHRADPAPRSTSRSRTTTAASSRSGRTGSCTSASATAARAATRTGNGQNPSTLLGKVLRLDVDGEPCGEPYAIPADNPFADGDGGAPEVFLVGLRNPWRFSFDRETGALWIADVGQNAVRGGQPPRPDGRTPARTWAGT